MTESLRSDSPTPEKAFIYAVKDHESAGDEWEPRTITEEFMRQCLEEKAGTRANLAEFILAALKQSPETEWARDLQGQKIVPEDDDYVRLMNQDPIYKSISELSHKTRPVVGHGNVLALERKALVELMELRAGQSLSVGDPMQLKHLDDAWNTIIANLFKGWEAIRS